MRTVNIGKLKNELSTYLRYVKNGEEVFIHDRKMPVAKIVPLPAPALDTDDYAAEEAYLIATGQMKPALEEIDWKAFQKMPRPSVSKQALDDAVTWAKGHR
jgi:antitoxin (DNA-binding transcriptional repressor) of toxin-antitoxin stability system